MNINGYNLKINDKLKFLINNYETNFLPQKENLFRALELTNFNDVKVVILGQDPYPNIDDANGLAFSVDRDYNLPKSLKNIFIELENDLNIKRNNGDLSDWAKQGVLLLNTKLSVIQNQPNSHQNLGWEELTKKIIYDLSLRGNVIFVLLGKNAQDFSKNIIKENNIIITAPHPSPLSAYRGFFGSKIFSQINENLKTLGYKPINW